MNPPICKLCEKAHWTWDEHATGSEEVRKVGASVLRKSVTKPPNNVTRDETTVKSDEIGAAPVHVKKAVPTDGGAQLGRPKKHADHAARQRAYRGRSK